jgi:hypothetical protein
LQQLFVERQMSKPVAVRTALKKVLVDNSKKTDGATEWVVRWRGIMASSKSTKLKDDRVAHILAKHLR